MDIVEHGSIWRLAIFASLFLLFALIETLFPAFPRRTTRTIKWRLNIGVSLLNSLILRFCFPIATLGIALWTEKNGIGAFPLLNLPTAAALIAGFLLLDLSIYGQHVAMHHFPFLWRLHKMHHSDKQLDVSTGLRFHPFEIILSQLFKMLVIIILGIPAFAVLLFEIALNAGSLFSHSNFRLKGKTLKTFGLLLVTPNMHEAHHNIEKKTSLHNYGFCLNLWDKAFHTYLPPNTPLPNKKLGLTNINEKDSLTIWKSLTLPLRN